MPDTKQDFLRSLKVYVSAKLKAAGLVGVMVETYEQAGDPIVEIHGTQAELREVKRVLRSYSAMLILKPRPGN